MFRQNPTFALTLRSLELGGHDFADDAEELQLKDALLELCPKLERLPQIFDYGKLRISDALPSFRAITGEEPEPVITQSDIDLLSSKCTALEDAYHVCSELQATDFRPLSNLTRLSLMVSDHLRPSIRFQFPPSLRDLSVMFEAQLHDDSDANALLASISSLPELTTLRIEVANNVSQAAFLKLVSSLTTLTYLGISNSNPQSVDGEHNGTVELNHPSFVSLPSVSGMNFSVVPRSLPKMRSLFCSPSSTDIHGDFYMPRLRHIGVEDIQLDPSILAGRFKLLDSLQMWGGSDFKIPTALPELRSLKDLYLDVKKLSQALCADLVRQLTRLQSLRLRQTPTYETIPAAPAEEAKQLQTVNSLDWLQHPMLQLFSFAYGRILLQPIEFRGISLPFLTDCQISFESILALPSSIRFDRLPNRRSLRISSARNYGIDESTSAVVVSQCPMLHYISLSAVRLSCFVLRELPVLHSLCLAYCPIVGLPDPRKEQGEFSVIGLPQLRIFEWIPSTQPSEEEAQLLATIRGLTAAQSE
eukprot:TRINITY_DN4265_c0_g1_i1.p1 TRINITY_DN4265_c0_g1~~TRINITY_DN4265_c0_g1_i1.p1  ORF type:complete len:531 (+),score=52.52 TRINITY_DN4265_c0_g1_i1:128-1720(+)